MKTNSVKTLLLLSLIIAISSCESNEPEITNASVSIETTNENAEKTYTTINVRGMVSSDGGSPIINRGICWSTMPNPTIEDNFITESSDEIEITVSNLLVNTAYHFRTFATTEIGTAYSEQQIISTLSLDNTSWEFTTIYPSNDFEIHSRVDFLDDNTTIFDEILFPGVFTTYGTWFLDNNHLTYIWEGADPNKSTYVYTGIINEMSISGEYTHFSIPNAGTWTAIEL